MIYSQPNNNELMPVENKINSPHLTGNTSYQLNNDISIPIKLSSLTANTIKIQPLENFTITLSNSTNVPISITNENITFTIKQEQICFILKNIEYVSKEISISGECIILQKPDKIYSGKLILSVINNKIAITDILDLETYVKGVLDAEFPSSAEMSAISAQAIAIRTYAFRKSILKQQEICNTTHCQTFNGITKSQKISDAVDNTKGLIITYLGQPISAMYSTDAGGITESWSENNNNDNNFPYLTNVSDPININHIEWTYSIEKDKLARILNLKNNIQAIDITETTESHRTKIIKILEDNTNNNVILVSGESLRSKLGNSNIKSTLFSVNIDNDLVIFSGRGYGHGYGLCQRSAIEMGKNNYTYEDILSHFYPETEIQKISDTIKYAKVSK